MIDESGLSESAKKGIGFEFVDLELIGATPKQREIVGEVLDDILKNKYPSGQKVTFGNWGAWLMIFPSGLMVPYPKECEYGG